MEITSLLLVASAPVVDIDGTAYVQLVIFLALMAVLYPLLFKPWLETLERRSQAIAGAVAEADRLRSKAGNLGGDYDKKLAAIRDEAQSIRNEARHAAEADRHRVVGAARSESGRDLELARERAVKESREAREALQGQIEALARDVSAKILGRSL
ncbi:MAG TPA: ATP synthase F0 subunit B [Nannocystaceae bacterium]|nr:ATP synthase F0 subunit B [Nannocystaceae bacterium]